MGLLSFLNPRNWPRRSSRSKNLQEARDVVVHQGFRDLERHLPPGFGMMVRRIDRQGLDRLVKSIATQELWDQGILGQPEWTEWNYESAVEHGYMASTWVFACMYRFAQSVASVPWRVGEGIPGQDWRPIEGPHPLKDVLEQPNPFQSFPGLMAMSTLHLHAGGNMLLAKLRPGDAEPPAELYLHAPDFAKIRPVPHRRRFIDRYDTFRNGAFYDAIDREDMVHHMLPNPMNPRWGMPTIQGIGKAVDTDAFASSWQVTGYANDARPSVVVVYDHDLSPEQHTIAKDRIAEQTGPDNARRPLVLGNRARLERWGFNPTEMDHLNSRGFTLQEICSGFNTPPPMIGIYENATLANLEQSRTVYWLDTIIPFLTSLRSTLNQRESGLSAEYGPNVRLNYDLRGVQALEAIQEKREERAERMFGLGVPFNELTEALDLGYSQRPDGDRSYISVKFVPADQVAPDASGSLPNPLDEE